MCGLAGFVGDGNESNLKEMSEKLIHRGPDSFGYYTHKDLFFSHRRLSIIDLSDNASQPMTDSEESVVIIFNGEIYNFLELRRLLESSGYKFRSNSDTEVLIAGYKKWGTDLPKFLNGMFAFAIYDRLKQKMFLCRDRFGEKPLYYFFDGKNFAFASELTSLIQYPKITPKLSKISLQKYFAYGYVPAPLTIYEGCSKLKPGSLAIFDLTKKDLQIRPFWKFEITNEYASRSEKDLIEELDSLILKSVKSRLISDVKLGLFLSGGIDSAAVLAYALQILDKDQIQTFTIGFNEKSFDESFYAVQTADFFGVKNFKKIIDFEVIKNSATEILSKLDEPIADSSIIPTYFLSRFAKESITVALSGDGGDEMFAGYDTFSALKIAQIYNKIVPKILHKKISLAVDLLPISYQNMSLEFKAKRALHGLNYDTKFWNPTWLAPANIPQIEDLFNEKIKIEDLYSEVIEVWGQNNNKNLVDKTLEFYVNFYLPGSVLAKMDRSSMMNSLEARAIFLDKDIADFAMKLPSNFKIKNGVKKYLLKELLKNKLPKEILNRKKKGFGMPVSSLLLDFPKEIPSKKISGINQKVVENIWLMHRNKKSDNRLFMWSWMALQNFAGASN